MVKAGPDPDRPSAFHGLLHRFAGESDGNAVIGTGLTVAGDLECAEELLINGTVNGDIRAESVVINETGLVDGNVCANSVHVHGTAKGRIEAIDVTVGRTGKVYATVFHYHLNVEPGAIMQGRRPWRPRDHIEQRITELRFPIKLQNG